MKKIKRIKAKKGARIRRGLPSMKNALHLRKPSVGDVIKGVIEDRIKGKK